MTHSSKWHALRVTTALVCCFFPAACMPQVNHEGQSLPGIPVIDMWQALIKKNPASLIAKDDAQETQWWTMLGDSTLNALVDRALAHSHILAAAETRVSEAEADAGLARANRMPQVNGSASVKKLRDSDGPNGTDRQNSLGLQGSWDIDPAGINRKRQKAALAGLAAARADRDRVRIDVIADVATAYVRLRGAQAQLKYAKANLGAQQNTLAITRGQRDEGVIGDFDVARTQAQAELTRARIPQIETSIVAAINRLNVLCGETPGTLDGALEEPAAIPGLPAKTVVSMPVSVLAQRPDIQASSFRLHEATQLTEAAALEIYPTLSLSAFFGLDHSQRAGSINPWNYAAGAVAPLLNFGRIQARVDSASALELRAFHDYQQTVITAVAEVEDALTAYLNEQRRQDTLALAVREQSRAATIVREQFSAGEAEHLGLLLAEKDELDAQLALAASRAQAAENLVRLYRALGWGAGAATSGISEIQDNAIHRAGMHKMQPVMDE